jgi:hypothetical protein
MSYTTSLQLGNKHQEMVSILDFYEKDIDFLKKMLAEVLDKNSKPEVRTAAEHFQNQFFIQLKNIDDLKNKILLNKHESSLEAKIHAGKIDKILVNDIQSTEKEVNQIEKIINDIRKDFKSFVAKWM